MAAGKRWPTGQRPTEDDSRQNGGRPFQPAEEAGQPIPGKDGRQMAVDRTTARLNIAAHRTAAEGSVATMLKREEMSVH